jgi:hypothetical protein
MSTTVVTHAAKRGPLTSTASGGALVLVDIKMLLVA